jgi:ACS family glucarate transporter-like MFS transporter
MATVAPARPTRTRHIVLWLTVALYLITYMDRVVIGATMPLIAKEFEFDNITIGWILGAFQISYALFQIPGGWMGDRIGPRRALSAVVVWWSAFTAITALSWNATSMIIFRFLFGMGEAGAFPIATRSLSRWMLPSERGWAQGITHAGARLGGALTPILVAWIMLHLGWRAPFFIFAVVGIVWGVVWYTYYRDSPEDHKGVNEAERELIRTALVRKPRKSSAVPWKEILSSPQMWMLAAMYACYGYSINIYLQWFPKYLVDTHNMSLVQMGLFASAPLMAGVLGDMAGGYVSDKLIDRIGLKWARRLVAIVGFSVGAITIMMAINIADPVMSVAVFALAVFALELTVGVSWAVALDIGDEFAGSVSAVMNTAGNLGGTGAAVITGYLVTAYNWNTAFAVLGVLGAISALIFFKIDATKRVYKDDPDPAPT